MTPADRLLWVIGLMWVAFIALGFAIVIAREIVERLRPRRDDLFINRHPDERLHRPGSVVDFQRYLSARRFAP